MKLARFVKNNKIYYGEIFNSKIKVIKGNIFNEFKVINEEFNIDEVKILAPVLPSKIVCVGLNYADHAKEMGLKTPDEPVIFIKPSTSVIGPEDDIIYPDSVSQLDYEAELAIIIKNRIKNIIPAEAKENILGYTCLNDVTARDLQRKDGQWTRAKSFDTFCPIGPFIVNDIDPDNLSIKLYLNGQIKQDSNTGNFIFKTDFVVSFISRIMTLYPGDIISTGTPSGIGPMNVNDNVTVEIEGIGSLKNSIKRKTRSD
ncbi:MAG: fumarylacetoacetate hydrolase family protein [bacterium]|nr:fumarylacetoacetate hydrolase family protein [bacterium]